MLSFAEAVPDGSLDCRKALWKSSTRWISVTQREFLTAQEHGIPTISFVEAQVLNYKKVYEADPKAALWDSFPEMDQPRKTFEFIDSITASTVYNGLIPFTSISDAKRILKLQIADFVGERLNETIKPVRSEVQEVLAEIKTLRNQMAHSGGGAETSDHDSRTYLTVMRFLLDDKHADFRRFVEQLAGDLDAAIPELIKSKRLEDLVSALGFTMSFEDDRQNFEALMHNRQPTDQPYIRNITSNMHGWYGIFTDNRVVLNLPMAEHFRKSQVSLQSRLKL